MKEFKQIKNNHNHISLRQKYHSELAVLKLINSFYWKSKIGPIMSIALPLMFMIIYKFIGSQSSNPIVGIFVNGFASYLSFGILPICLVTLPQMIVELKTSIVLRKISISKINSYWFSLIILIYYLLHCLANTIIIILIYAIFLNVDAPKYFPKIAWGGLIYAILNLYIVSLAFGLMIGVLVKRSGICQVLGFGILLLSVTLAGHFIPINIIASSNALKYLSLFSPMSYSLNLINNASITPFESLPPALIDWDKWGSTNFGTNIFDLTHNFSILKLSKEVNQNTPQVNQVTIYFVWQKIMNLFMSYIISAVFLFVALKKFNWTSR